MVLHYIGFSHLAPNIKRFVIVVEVGITLQLVLLKRKTVFFFCSNKGHSVRMCRTKSRLSNKSGSHEQHQVETDDVNDMQTVDALN